MQYEEVLEKLEFLKNKKFAKGMSRFGIKPKRKKEFVKRTAFTLMACLAVHNNEMIDKDFLAFFPLIKKESVDERNFIKKAVNWALRQIGKKNKNLHKKVIILAKEIYNINSKSAKWIANNAIRELESNKIKNKIYGFKR